MSAFVASTLVPVASPSIAESTTAADPIFAAIEGHRLASAKVEAAIAAETSLLDDLPRELAELAERDHPHVQSGWWIAEDGRQRPKWLTSHEEIDEIYTPGWSERAAHLHAGLDADRILLEAAWEQTGIAAARKRVDASLEESAEALHQACATRPTTLAGVIFFVSFLRREVFECERGSPGEDVEALAWSTLDVALRDIAGTSA